MAAELPAAAIVTDKLLFDIARDIAMDIHTLPDILEHYGLNPNQFSSIRDSHSFQTYLRNEIAAWQTATNTHERVKLKTAAMLEAWLPELNARLHDRQESLAAKIEGGKLAARIAGMGLNVPGTGEVGEKFSVTINMGAEKSVRFEKTIEHAAEDE